MQGYAARLSAARSSGHTLPVDPRTVTDALGALPFTLAEPVRGRGGMCLWVGWG